MACHGHNRSRAGSSSSCCSTPVADRSDQPARVLIRRLWLGLALLLLLLASYMTFR